MASLQSILRPQVLTKVVSRQAATSDWLLNLFGVQPGGPNEENWGHGRTGSYNIYDNVRTVGRGKAPGTAAARRAANPLSTVAFTYPRMHDSVGLPAEILHNLGRIDNPAMRDVAGADMIRRQTNTLAQIASNWRKAMLVGTLRDSLFYVPDNDSFHFAFADGTDPAFKLPTQMPAGNKSQLDMLGGGDIINTSWATTNTADIPNDLGQINAAFQQLCGGGLKAVICPWAIWNHVINNDVVQAMHGTASPPFVSLTRDQLDPALGNTQLNVFRAMLTVLPDVTWYVTDEGIDIGAEGDETFTKIVGANNAIFVGHDPSQGAMSCYLGSEPIAEYDNGPKTVKTGLASWSVERSNPTSTDLFVLDNSLIVNHVPKSIAYGTVVF